MNDVTKHDETKGTPQAEDRVFKTAIACFQKELLPYLEIYEEVCSAAPTEMIHLELRQMYQDFNYVAKDGGWLHFEFVSGTITKNVMRTFRRYEAVTSCAFNIPVTTYVVYTGKTKEPRSELTEGINTYRVNIIHLKERNADELFKELEHKHKTARIEKKDLVSVTLTPLMSGEMPVKERIIRGMEFLKEHSSEVDEEEHARMEAMMYALATKFLDDKDMQDVVEVINMTKLGELLMERGVEKGKTEGKAESILELLAYKGELPAEFKGEILGERNTDTLRRWLKLAMEVTSVEEFRQKM